MLKKFTYLVLLLIYALYAYVVAELFLPPLLIFGYKYHVANNGCINKIKTTNENERQIVYNSLDFFNKLGHNRIIRWCVGAEKEVPIDITVRKFVHFEESMFLGWTSVYLTSAEIHIRNSRSRTLDYRNTIIHELIHAFGYTHSTEESDIMYFRETYHTDEDSIKRYAEEIENRIWN